MSLRPVFDSSHVEGVVPLSNEEPDSADASHALVTRDIKIRVVYKTAQIDRTLALVAAEVGLFFIPARRATPAVKQVQVADMNFSRTYGLLWSRERENDFKEFIEFAESHSWAV